MRYLLVLLLLLPVVAAHGAEEHSLLAASSEQVILIQPSLRGVPYAYADIEASLITGDGVATVEFVPARVNGLGYVATPEIPAGASTLSLVFHPGTAAIPGGTEPEDYHASVSLLREGEVVSIVDVDSPSALGLGATIVSDSPILVPEPISTRTGSLARDWMFTIFGFLAGAVLVSLAWWARRR